MRPVTDGVPAKKGGWLLPVCLCGLAICLVLIITDASRRTAETLKATASTQPTATAPQAKDLSNWYSYSESNPVTGEITITATLKDHDEQDIIIRQTGKKLELYIKTGEFLETVDNMEDHLSTVQYKLDDGKVVKQAWSLSSDNEALFYPGNPKGFVEQLRKAQVFSFEFKPSDKVPQTVVFDVGGLPDVFK
jgi:hypothetical protein